jgi:ubiquinone/menaquinone biosynthesis C-methylase UbiE
MNKNLNQIDTSYQMHIENEKKSRITGAFASCYYEPDNIDNWRHERMRNIILPLIEFFPNSSWITIGDGSYGSDAYFLQNKGLDVLATSISDETLSEAHKLGFIKKYKAINSERITECDRSFDFVFCKEAYHHFPRPPIALYEMIRVARNAVILIEPQENREKLLDFFKKTIKTTLRKKINPHYENTGNYIFRVNIKEITKMVVALDFEYIAYKKFNDFFISKFSSKSTKGINWAKLVTALGIFVQNIFCKISLLNFGLATVVIFKNDVNPDLIKKLYKNGYTVIKLPRNPYFYILIETYLFVPSSNWFTL